MTDEIYKERSIIKNSLVKKTCKCDVCDKIIYEELYDEREKPVVGKEYEDIVYFVLRTGHNGWGNDSIESYETIDVCSKKCLGEKFLEYIGTKDKDGTCDDYPDAIFDVESENKRVCRKY